LTARLEWCSNIILRHAQKPAQGQCFGIYQTTNPKTLNPKTLKTLNPQPEHTAYHCVFSAISHVQQQGILNVAGQTTGAAPGGER